MEHNEIQMDERLIRMPEVERLCGLKRSSIYRRIAEDAFVKPVSLGGRAIGFPASQVQKWISDRISGGQRKAQ